MVGITRSKVFFLVLVIMLYIILHFIEATTDLATENPWQVTILKNIISQMEMSACREKISEGTQICNGGITRIKHRWPNPIHMFQITAGQSIQVWP